MEDPHRIRTSKGSSMQSSKDNDCTIIEIPDSQETAQKSSNAKNVEQDDCTVIETVHVSNKRKIDKSHIHGYNEILKENELFAEFIGKCLIMANSQGMLRVINRTLVPIYNNADKVYKKSETFKYVLKQELTKLDIQPGLKFSHMKNLCEILKSHAAKKRVSFTTLQTKLTGHLVNSSSVGNLIPRKRKKIQTIDLESDNMEKSNNCDSKTKITKNKAPVNRTKTPKQMTSDHVEIVDSDETGEDNEVILIVSDGENDNSNKENSCNTTNNNKQCLSLRRNPKRVETEECNDEPDPQENDDSEEKPGYLVEIERKIAAYKKIIKQLEEKEVCEDSLKSPYMVCEKYKASIVKLYKEICSIMGTEPVKHHEVKLQVTAGHHQGPAKCLEEFINDNIDKDGEPPFPDIYDVVQCVNKANLMYQLGWNNQQVFTEARALFTHYGNAIQKRRQKREYRDMLTYVKEEVPDPAEEDAALQERLLENSRIALKNETDLLDRFARMERSRSNTEMRVDIVSMEDSVEDSDYESASPVPSGSNKIKLPKGANANYKNQLLSKLNYEKDTNFTSSPNVIHDENDSPHSDVQTEFVESKIDIVYHYILTDIADNGSNSNTLIDNEVHSKLATATQISQTIALQALESNTIKIQKNIESFNIDNRIDPDVATSHIISSQTPESNAIKIEEGIGSSNIDNEDDTELTTESDEIHTQCITEKCYKSETSETIAQNNNEGSNNSSIINNELKSNLEGVKNLDIPIKSVAGTSQTENESLIVNKETKDIPYLLEQLGNNFTATIIDIEDPFLMIEISDSSDSDDEGFE